MKILYINFVLVQNQPFLVNRWQLSTNAKDIGVQYIIFAGLSGLVGSTLSFKIRKELSGGGSVYFLGNYHDYNVTITGHAILKIFFKVKPAKIGGFGNWLVPVKIGCKDKAKPRLNNVGFWLLPPSLILLITGLFSGGAGTGWTLDRIKIITNDLYIHRIGGPEIKSNSGLNFLNLTRCENLPDKINLTKQTTNGYIRETYDQCKNVYDMGTIRQELYSKFLQRLGSNPKQMKIPKKEHNNSSVNVRTIKSHKAHSELCVERKGTSLEVPRYYKQFSEWLVGFTDGDGTFTIDRQYGKNGEIKWNLVYKISQSKVNGQLIHYIKNTLGIGHVTDSCNMKTYRVRDLTQLTKKIFPIFDEYPQQTTKQFDYVLIKEAAKLIAITEETTELNRKMELIYDKLINIRNSGTENSNTLNITDNWQQGFWEAEGSLYITKKSTDRYTHGLGITQKKDRRVQEEIRIRFQSKAQVRYNKNGFYSWDSTSKLVINRAIKFLEGGSTNAKGHSCRKQKGRKSLTFSIWKKSQNYTGAKLIKSRDLIRKVVNQS